MNNICLLDQIRIKQGRNSLERFFKNLILNNTYKAINIINNESLQYPSLYLLRNIIKGENLYWRINTRNKIALDITDGILNRRKEDRYKKYLSRKDFPKTYFIMKWILDTGYRDDGLDNQYDDVLDTTGIILIKVYNDKASLPIISHLLFSRNRRNTFIHDLLWALYESKSLDSILLISRGLLSKNPNDFMLARQLFSFIPEVKNNKNGDNAYKYFMKWFNVNKNFLKYTGESFQTTNKPEPYKVVDQAKYLCKPISMNNGKFEYDLTEIDNKRIEEFNELNLTEKKLLSNYSYNLYNRNKKEWNKWMSKNISKQLITVKKMGGHI